MGSLHKGPHPSVDLESIIAVFKRPNHHPKAEPVLDLWPKLSLLRIHRSDKRELGRVRRQTPPPDNHASLCSSIKDRIGNQVIQQVVSSTYSKFR